METLNEIFGQPNILCNGYMDALEDHIWVLIQSLEF